MQLTKFALSPGCPIFPGSPSVPFQNQSSTKFNQWKKCSSWEIFLKYLCKVDYVVTYLWPCWSILAPISRFSPFSLNITKTYDIYSIHTLSIYLISSYDKKQKQKRKTFEPWFPLFPDGPRGPMIPWKYDIKCMLQLLLFFSRGKLSTFKHTIKRLNWPWDPYYQMDQRHQANLSAPVKASKGAIKKRKSTVANNSKNKSML